MKIWIDILTPKQLLFFRPLAENLRKRHDVLVTTRRYRELDGLIHLFHFEAMVVGRHGGGKPKAKLEASAERTLELANLVGDWQPDIAVSFSSPECARIAFGLGMPHLCANDSPHAEKVARLTLPLATHVASPWIIPFREWARYGISRRQWTPYRAIDPAAWLKAWRFRKISGKLGLTPLEFIVFRPEMTEASHLEMKSDATRLSVMKELCRRFEDYKVVVLPRYSWQVEEARKLNLNNLVVIGEPVLSPDLLVDAALFVGMGGTMSAEAALLGVPVISLYLDEPTYVERYLSKMRLVERVQRLGELIETAKKILGEGETIRNVKDRAAKVLRSMEDPTENLRNMVLSLEKGSA